MWRRLWGVWKTCDNKKNASLFYIPLSRLIMDREIFQITSPSHLSYIYPHTNAQKTKFSISNLLINIRYIIKLIISKNIEMKNWENIQEINTCSQLTIVLFHFYQRTYMENWKINKQTNSEYFYPLLLDCFVCENM